jgi:hypothetical protein
MTRKDFDLLKKIMDRTRSESDYEALASLRAANRLIEKNGVSWERFFERSVRVEVEQDPERSSNETRYDGRDLGGAHPPASSPFQPRAQDRGKRYEDTQTYDRDHGHAKGSVADEIESYFRAIDARNIKSDFIESLRGQWHEKGWLSPKQVAKLSDHAQEAKYR